MISAFSVAKIGLAHSFSHFFIPLHAVRVSNINISMEIANAQFVVIDLAI